MINEQIISQSNDFKDCIDDLPYDSIPALIDQLKSTKNNTRIVVRAVLSCIGRPAIPALIKALDDASTQLRWQIIKILETIRDPAAIPALANQLKDENADIRWAASNALIGLRRETMPQLLEMLVHHSDSSALRQSVHHILHVFKDRNILNDAEIKVYNALEDIEPTLTVPWMAERALEYLERHKN